EFDQGSRSASCGNRLDSFSLARESDAATAPTFRTTINDSVCLSGWVRPNEAAVSLVEEKTPPR
ncbi:MAG TPA: hypothetical protein VGE52_15770, partial [Pirellulales bacterium]